MSTIYWKFKNTKTEFSSITFDSTHVSILDLKRAIIKQKKLEQSARQPFDLSITNAHTGVEYTDETGPIPRNLAVIVRRLPAARNQHRRLWSPLTNNSVIATADNISKKVWTLPHPLSNSHKILALSRIHNPAIMRFPIGAECPCNSHSVV